MSTHQGSVRRIPFGPFRAAAFAVAAVTAVACGVIETGGKASSDSPPNVILISIDTLRADHLSAYGYRRKTSPHLDRFAKEEAILFEQVINTGGGTLPVHITMMTSLPPLVHGIVANAGKSLPDERITLAEELQKAGFATAAFTGGGWVVQKYGFAQGFDSFEHPGRGFEKSLPPVFDWLRNHRDQRFFLFLHTYDVHSASRRLPYDSPGKFNDLFLGEHAGSFDGCMFDLCASKLLSHLNTQLRTKKLVVDEVLAPDDIQFMVDLYDGGIAYVDHELERLFELLRELDLWDDSVVVVTADHGEEFLEHGLFLHHQNYEEVARVPLMIKLPGSAGAGTRVGGLVSTLDIMPTILDAAGMESNPEAMGRSVLPMAFEGEPGSDSVFIAGAVSKLRTSKWSCFVANNGDPVKLFDIVNDPHETRDLLRKNREVGSQLAAVHGHLKKQQLAVARSIDQGGAVVGMTQEEENELKALGYLHSN